MTLNMKKRVYYAHSIKIYDTSQEVRELAYLNKEFTVFNPKNEIRWNSLTKMTPYFEAVKKSDILVASEYKNHVGRGVYDEISIALSNSIPSFVLRKEHNFKLLEIQALKLDDIYDWKVYYGIIIT
ncbi:hypothetical protein LCGC14_0795690 [marine sediment metagenome]|uniref:Uncharacterized protein n=2 Tax=marine sediment metagenome TaxID=412755 RepID=A0A0F9PR28_9ZZZZ